MRSRTVFLGVASGLLLVTAVHAAQVAWRARMDRLGAALSALLPDVVSNERFLKPENKPRILKNARILSELAHDVRSAPDKPQPDPSLAFMGELLAGEAQEAEWALQQGNMTYARAVLFSVANACIGCHARNDQGPAFPVMPVEPNTNKLTRFEKATLDAALRRYDQALTGYQAILADPGAPLHDGLDWDRAASAALAIAVRVKRDPVLAGKIAEQMVKTEAAPAFVRRDALMWKEAIRTWSAEPPPPAPTEENLHTRARVLHDEATRVRSPLGLRGKAIELLRATTLLHDQLALAPDGKLAAEALHLLGRCYQNLESLEQWTLEQMYFEACIHKRPHSATSRACYEDLETAIWVEYTGTGSPRLPPNVQTRLNALREKAY